MVWLISAASKGRTCAACLGVAQPALCRHAVRVGMQTRRCSTPNARCNTGIVIAFKCAAITAMLETAAFVTSIASCCHVNSCWMPTIYSMRHHSMTSVGNTESVTCQQPTVRVGEHVGRKERRYSQKML